MSNSIQRLGLDNTENRNRVLHAPNNLQNGNQAQNGNVLRIGQQQLQDQFQVRGATRARGLEREADGGITTGGVDGNNASGRGSESVNDLSDSTRVELSGAKDSLAQSVESNPPKPPSLPPGDLKTNPDGSITTPGGYTIMNDGGHQWRIKDPTGIETKIFGDPHVDEGNDGTVDWHFNKDGTFILPDGTKIFCDTDKVAEGITASSTLKIQYQDQLGTMDVANGGAGTVEKTGGLAFDSANKDGELYVMGTDGKFYDGETLGKLYDAGGDFARDVDGQKVGHISQNALISLQGGLVEEGLTLKAKDPVGPVGVDDKDPNVKDDKLAELLALGDNAFIVNDTDGEVTAAMAGKRKIDAAHVLGQANKAEDGFETLKSLDINGDGVVSGAELDGIKVWVDANNDGVAQDGEVKLMTEFKVDSLKVKLAAVQDQDGTTRLHGQFERDGEQTTTNDRLNPLNDGAQGTNFQRQLNEMVGTDRTQRALAQRQLNLAMDRHADLQRDIGAAAQNGDLARQANNQAQRQIRG